MATAIVALNSDVTSFDVIMEEVISNSALMSQYVMFL